MNEAAGQYQTIIHNIIEQLKDAQVLAGEATMGANNKYLISELRLQALCAGWKKDRVDVVLEKPAKPIPRRKAAR